MWYHEFSNILFYGSNDRNIPDLYLLFVSLKGGDVKAALSDVFSREKTVNKVINVSVNDIIPNPAQPRKTFDMSELKSLSESIKNNGILQPLTVRKVDNKYEIIAGERRLRASQMCGLEYVACIVMDITAQESTIYAILENLQRQNLSFFEEAAAYYSLINDWNITQEQASEKLGKAQSTIANKLRLLKLDKLEQSLIIENNLTERHARSLLRLDSKEIRIKVIDTIVERNLNVSQTEDLIDEILNVENKRKNKKKIPTILIRDIRVFFNTVDKAIETMKNAGVDVGSKKVDHDEYIEYVVTIAKSTAKKKEEAVG